MPPDMLVNHWLLNLAIEYPVWLASVFPVVDTEGLNAKSVPGCSSEIYADNLLALFDAGLIKFTSEVPGDDAATEQGIRQILSRFVSLSIPASSPKRNVDSPPLYNRNRLLGIGVTFEVTPLGGAAWERVAEPDWLHILTESRDSTSGELTSPDRDLLIAYMGWYPELNRERILLETVRWQTHSNHKILYWKRLPFVYHASFGLQPTNPRWETDELNWFRQWRWSALTWHKNPWELPDWPSQ